MNIILYIDSFETLFNLIQINKKFISIMKEMKTNPILIGLKQLYWNEMSEYDYNESQTLYLKMFEMFSDKIIL